MYTLFEVKIWKINYHIYILKKTIRDDKGEIYKSKPNCNFKFKGELENIVIDKDFINENEINVLNDYKIKNIKVVGTRGFFDLNWFFSFKNEYVDFKTTTPCVVVDISLLERFHFSHKIVEKKSR